MSVKSDAAGAEIVRLVRPFVQLARIRSLATRDAFTCVIIVDTDIEKRLVNDNPSLIAEMKEAATRILNRPVYITAESHETVDRRWAGDWNSVFR